MPSGRSKGELAGRFSDNATGRVPIPAVARDTSSSNYLLLFAAAFFTAFFTAFFDAGAAFFGGGADFLAALFLAGAFFAVGRFFVAGADRFLLAGIEEVLADFFVEVKLAGAFAAFLTDVFAPLFFAGGV